MIYSAGGWDFFINNMQSKNGKTMSEIKNQNQFTTIHRDMGKL